LPQFITDSLIAGILASFACGLGALPLAIKGLDVQKHTGIAYAGAGGLMFAASVYNLILPGLTLHTTSIQANEAITVVFGILLGALFLSQADRYLSPERLEQANWKKFGNKSQLLIFIAMAVHSIPEGVGGWGRIFLGCGVFKRSRQLHRPCHWNSQHPRRTRGSRADARGGRLHLEMFLGGVFHQPAATDCRSTRRVCLMAVPAHHARSDGVRRRGDDLPRHP
jgi:hypothetical protein